MSLERRQQANARQSAAAKYAERKRQAYMEQQRNRREDRLEEMRRMMVIAATSQDGTSTLQGPEPGEDDSAETVCKDEQEQQPSSSTPCRVGKSTAVGPASASVSDQKQDADIEMSQRPRSTIRRAQRPRPKPRGRACGEQLVRQLQMPEWMVDVPPDLGQRWFVLPRPFGCRCLVVAARGNTRSWSRTGAPLHSFASHLPNGSRATAGPQDHFCMLDCVYHEADSTYYITDVLAWNGQLLADCSVEFRMYWMHAKLRELADSQALPTLSQSHRFAAVPVWRCGGGGLACAYSSPVPYERDGLLLLHEDAHHLPGRSPLRLLWKDGHISRYLLDTDKHGMVPEQQAVVLQFCADGTVATSDEPPLALGSLPQQFQDSLHAKLHPGFLLRFRVMPGGLRWDSSGQPAGAHMVFDGVPNQRRGGADCFSKILFQYCARSQQLIAIQHLLQAAEDIAEGGSSAMDMLRPQAALATEDSASGTQDHDMAP